MLFTETKLADAYIIDLERREDDRGYFARAFCRHEFAEHGLNTTIAQANVAFNGTRHAPRNALPVPSGGGDEARPLYTRRDRRRDRRSSAREPDVPRAVAVELTEENGRALYVPERFAHGYQVSQTRRRPAIRSESSTRRSSKAGCVRRPPAGPGVALAGQGDVGEGPRLGAARGVRARVASAHELARPRRCAALIIVDTALQALEAEDKPIRVGLIGAGFMAQGLCNQITNSVPGMRVAAIYGRRVDRAVEILRYSGFADAEAVSSADAFDAALRQRRPVATDDPFLLTQSDQIDVLVELTGSVEFGAQVAMDAFAHRKAVILMNAEVDATIGPILHVHAHGGRRPLGHRRRRAGDPDQPVPLGARPRPDAAGDRERQGPSGSISKPDDPAGVCRAAGARTPQWSRRSPTARRSASSRRSSRTPPASRSSARHVARREVRRFPARARRPLRPRRDSGARRNRRLHGRAAEREGVLPRGARRSEAAPLP